MTDRSGDERSEGDVRYLVIMAILVGGTARGQTDSVEEEAKRDCALARTKLEQKIEERRRVGFGDDRFENERNALAHCHEWAPRRAAAKASEEARVRASARAQVEDDSRREEKVAARLAWESDPVTLRMAWSGNLCYAKKNKAAALADIAKEKRGAKYGGVIDKASIHQNQIEILDSEDRDKESRAALRRLKLTALPCSDPLVARVTDCMGCVVCGDSDAAAHSRIVEQERCERQ